MKTNHSKEIKQNAVVVRPILPISEEAKNAFAARDDCPLSIKAFMRLFDHIPGPEGNAGFDNILAFLRENKLPIKKTMDWLARHNVKSD